MAKTKEAEAEKAKSSMYACCGDERREGGWQCNGACRLWFHASPPCNHTKQGDKAQGGLCMSCVSAAQDLGPRGKRQRKQ